MLFQLLPIQRQSTKGSAEHANQSQLKLQSTAAPKWISPKAQAVSGILAIKKQF